MNSEVGDVIDSPDGDWRKQGTITAAVELSNGHDGKLHSRIKLADPISERDEPAHALTRGEQKQAVRNKELLVATDLDAALGVFYSSDREVHDLIDQVRHYEGGGR